MDATMVRKGGIRFVDRNGIETRDQPNKATKQPRGAIDFLIRLNVGKVLNEEHFAFCVVTKRMIEIRDRCTMLVSVAKLVRVNLARRRLIIPP